MVAVEVDRVSNRVAGAVWVHQEHFYHLGEREDSESELPKLSESSTMVKVSYESES